MDQEQEEALVEAGRLLNEALMQGSPQPKAPADVKVHIGNVMLGPVTIDKLTQNFS